MQSKDIPKIGVRRFPLSGIRPNDETYSWRGLGNPESVAFKQQSYSLTDIILGGTIPGRSNRDSRNLDTEWKVSANIAENLRKCNSRFSEPAGLYIPFEIFCR